MHPRPRRGLAYFFPTLLFAGIAGLAAACNIGLAAEADRTNAGARGDVAFNESDAPNEAKSGSPSGTEPPSAGSSGDAGAAMRGSPLCSTGSEASTCSPDDTTTNTPPCNAAYYDAGASGSDASALSDGSVTSQARACRVRTKQDERVSVCSGAGTGGDGAECLRSADCAAGFECVRSPGRCRRYCCGLACAGDQSFCDIQPMATTGDEPGVLVPVCGPTRTCKLLQGPCDTDQTCAVVKQDGTTSCVSIGKARAGEDCERDHCAADLTCLGQPGSRKCYRLCFVNDMRSCTAPETCRGTAPLFKDSNVGVCE